MKAMSLFGGSLGRIWPNASSPPAEAPSPTIGNERRRGLLCDPAFFFFLLICHINEMGNRLDPKKSKYCYYLTASLSTRLLHLYPNHWLHPIDLLILIHRPTSEA